MQEIKNFGDLAKEKMRSTDRVLVLEVIDGEKIKSSTGMVDQRLFQGGNKLHAKRSPQYDLWELKYEQGAVPEPLRQKYTTFATLFKEASRFYEKRGLKISRVEDVAVG